MKIILLDHDGDIKCDYQGFACLVELYAKCKDCIFEILK